ncbi:MAG: SPOR domain-containing protein [Sphingomonas sp.]|nr:SPOR domain-containing protein [Sphingomonas sp.]
MRKSLHSRRLMLGLSLLPLLASASPAAAQYIDAAPPPPPALAPGVVLSPADSLGHYIRILAGSPRDFSALIGAGKAALDLGDTQAAIGFFGRAEEVWPTAPAAKAGLASTMVQMDDPQSAIAYFNQATRLGASASSVALDRGMARDLMGDFGSAQADYRMAMIGKSQDEARRRLALSLAIAKNKKGALDTLQPLLDRRDPAAQRTRAFVLALSGDRIAASQAIEAIMPGAAVRFDPFFRRLPNLNAADKAAAVHLGIFPGDAATRVAQATTIVSPVATVRQPRIASPSPPRSALAQPAAPVKIAVNSIASTNSPAPAPRPSFSLPSATNSAALTAIDPALAPAEAPAPAPATATELAKPAFSISDASPVGPDGRLSGIDKLLATIAEAPPPPPPAPKPRIEAKVTPALDAKPTKADKAAATKKLAEKKQRDEKLAAEKKAREEAEKLGVRGTNWVQLAGGSQQERMAIEYGKLGAKAGSLLKRPGYVTGGKDYFRLLVGPFDSKNDAQAFVNKLAKSGVDGFSWTRTPAQIRIEKLPSK